MTNRKAKGGDPRLGLALLAMLLSTTHLRAESSAAGDTHFRNIDPSVTYVGSKTCAASGCHEEIGRSYPETPMGHSMAPANSRAELARVTQPVTVFNAKNNRYYQVYGDGGDLYQSAWELDKKGRRIYSVTHKLDYVVGGGLTGYSYVFRIGAWLFQAPLSYYSHSGQWELSPGYNADDIGFTRGIPKGCLLCHNGQPEPEPKRDGKYKEPAFRFGELAIGCEACHGPGELHVREMQTKAARQLGPQEVDTSIVNPARLSPRLADDLCRDCHQAGDAVVLLPGRDFLDYRPGAPLSQTWAFLRRPVDERRRAEADRLETLAPVRNSLEIPLWWKNSSLELSRCYQASHGRLTCVTCHSVHHAPRPEEESAYYRSKCLTCHVESSCKLARDSTERQQTADNCVGCHMEKRPVAGIAHSSDTKHRIVRYPGQPLPDVAFAKPRPDLPGLLWLNRPAGGTGDPLPAVAQLEAYWMVGRKDQSMAPYVIRKLDELSKSAPNDPTVMACLGAVALADTKDNAKAADYFSRALKLGSEEPTTFLDLAIALNNLGRGREAEGVLQRGIAAYPYSGLLVANLARQYINDGQTLRASVVVRQYRKLFPEDPAVRDVLKQLEKPDSAVKLSIAPGRSTSTEPPQ